MLIAAVGSGWVFVINAASFLAMLGALLLINTVHRREKVEGKRESQFRQLSAGVRYVKGRGDLLVIFIMVFLVGAFSMNFPVMSSTMAVEFGRGAEDYGLLSSILAIGSLAGALLAARRPNARMRIVIIAVGGLGLVSLVGSVMPTFWSFAATLVFFGLATSTMLTTANGFVQTTSSPAVRGRVLALYMAILMGGTPVGAPLVGAAADALGARSTFVISGVAALVAFIIGMAWLLFARKLRVRWDQGIHITHVGRPNLGDDRRTQIETLTAPLEVLGRTPVEDITLPKWDSAPQEGSPATGVIDLDLPAPDNDDENPRTAG